MNYTKIFLNEFYSSNKKEFWLIIVGNIILGMIINLLPVHEFIQAGVVIIMALKSFSFLRGSTVMPSISSDFDRYSWKYFQGLPLSKTELIISLVVSNLISEIPLISWLMAFFPQIAGLFMDENQKLPLEIPAKIFLALFPVLLIISISALYNQIVFPRKQYSKVEAKIKYLNFIKNASIGLCVLFYGIFFYDFLSNLFNWQIGPYVLIALKFGWEMILSWWISPLLLVLAYLNYKHLITVWQDDKRAYSNEKWIPRRDVPITVFALVLLGTPIISHDWSLPDRYAGTPVHEATYHSDLNKLKSVVLEERDINAKNKFGYTPLMVAARNGNLAMYSYLKSKGAKSEGNVIVKGKEKETYNILYLAVKGGNTEIVKDLLVNKFSANEKFDNSLYSSPLLLASEMCDSAMVDLLIEKKADLNSINGQGKSALHLATEKKCFGVITSLIEGGINQTIKDKKGLTALAYAKELKHSKDLTYYLEKKARAPASQK